MLIGEVITGYLLRELIPVILSCVYIPAVVIVEWNFVHYFSPSSGPIFGRDPEGFKQLRRQICKHS
jgi:hypothetical protein